MNKKRMLALVLAAVMTVSSASAAFAAPEDVLDREDILESGLYNAMLAAGDGILPDTEKDGQLTEAEAAAIPDLAIGDLKHGALKGLEYCTGLTSLTIEDDGVEDLQFLKAESLTELTITDSTKLKNLSFLSGLKSLTTLDLSGCTALEDLDGIDGLTSLASLNISGTGVVDLSKCPTGLTALYASGNGIQDIASVANLTSLETLDLSDNKIEEIPDLKGLTSLTTFELEGNLIADREALKQNLPDTFADDTDWLDKVVSTPGAGEVDKSALKAAISNAEALVKATVESADGAGIPAGVYWATKDAIDTMKAAIVVAQGVADTSTDAQEVAKAVTTLNTAKATFEGARKEGQSAADTRELLEIIASAEELKADTAVSTDGSDVAKDKMWATAKAHQELEDAITAAKGVVDNANNKTQTDIDNAETDLNAAIKAFNAARKDGTKTESTGGNGGNSGNSGSSDRTSYDNREQERWDEVKDEIAEADEGDTIEVNANGLPYFPRNVIRELKGKDITLEIRKNGVTYKVNGLEIGAIEKLWYEFEDLDELLTAEDEAEKPEQDFETEKPNPNTGR